MGLLSDEEILKIRAKYPQPVKRPKIVKPTKAKVVKEVCSKRKPALDACYHWCPKGRHDWFHMVLRSDMLDTWEKVCPKCQRKKISTPIIRGHHG